MLDDILRIPAAVFEARQFKRNRNAVHGLGEVRWVQSAAENEIKYAFTRPVKMEDMPGQGYKILGFLHTKI